MKHSLKHSTTKVNSMRPGWDLNVSGVWQNQVNGQGVNVAIIDDGEKVVWWLGGGVVVRRW